VEIMQSIREMDFLTTAEVADKLKLHPQVILRKLKSGEIPGYKLGKEWRIASHELLEWLERHGNRQKIGPREAAERAFFKDDRLVSIPAQRKKRVYILERLLQEFEPNRIYSEAEVNEVLRRFHHDVCTLRREFICEHMMVRSGGRYRRASAYKMRQD
jgi:excisionase family DNA binding protein